MPIRYKIDILQALKERGITTYTIKETESFKSRNIN